MAGLLQAAESALNSSAERSEKRLDTMAWSGDRRSALMTTGTLGMYAAALVVSETIRYVRSRTSR